jgi:glycerol-3-phosphate dehydrogenase (NAD(P)+)
MAKLSKKNIKQVTILKSKVVIIGAGAWGSAITNLIAENFSNQATIKAHFKLDNKVFLVANDKNVIEEINHHHTNHKFLPKVKLNQNIDASDDLENSVKDADFIFIVTPSIAVLKTLKKISAFKLKLNVGFIICSKGLDSGRQKFFSEIFEEFLPSKKYAILSGPNFAIEVALKIPTITTLASKDKKFADKVSTLLDNSYFRCQYFDDVITTQICAIVKNIIAIGCGIIDGFNMGQNAKSALVSKGINEILLLCQKLSANSNLSNAAGFGDIFLTCSTTKSRNNLLGYKIAKGRKYFDLIKEENKTFEGASSVKSIVKLSKSLKIKLDLCETINQILFKNLNIQKIKTLIIQAILSK